MEEMIKNLAGKAGLGGKSGDLIGMITQQIQGNGGVGGLVEKLKSAGLESQAQSWVGTGDNASIDSDQAAAGLGNDFIQQASEKLGVPPSEVSAASAQILPDLVNHATPNGEVEENNGILDSLQGMMKNIDMGAIGGILKNFTGGKG